MGAARPSYVPRNAATSCAEVVEALGFGLAQIRIILFAHGVWFIDGIDMCLVAVCTPVWISEFSLTRSQAGLFTTFTFIGIGAGAFASSFPGDRIGRRVPIVACYFFCLVMCILSVMSESRTSLLLCRIGMGAAMGFGMSPSLALASESCPSAWRMTMVACKGFFAMAGLIVGNLFAMLLDPTLVHLDWRKIYLWCTIPSAVLSCGSLLFLPESAKFLAQMGNHAAAATALKSMRSLNFRPGISIEYSKQSARNIESIEHGTGAEGSSMSNEDPECTPVPMSIQLKVIFGKTLRGLTFAAMLANIGINLIQYHNNYGEPEVMTYAQSHSKHGTSAAPGVQLLIASCWGLIAFPVTILMGSALGRKYALVNCFLIMSIVTIVFGATAVLPDRDHWITKALFQCSLCGSRVIFAVAWNFVHQFSVEFYPAPISTTGGAISIAVGRVGSILAPLVFEWVSTASSLMTLSFYMMFGFGVLIAVLVGLLVPRLDKDFMAASVHAENEVQALMTNAPPIVFPGQKPSKAE